MVLLLMILLVWGPQKLPGMARAIGEAKKEFDKAARDVSSVAVSERVQVSKATKEPIITAAKSLSIGTEGKTGQELAEEILKRTATKSSIFQLQSRSPILQGAPTR